MRREIPTPTQAAELSDRWRQAFEALERSVLATHTRASFSERPKHTPPMALIARSSGLPGPRPSREGAGGRGLSELLAVGLAADGFNWPGPAGAEARPRATKKVPRGARWTDAC
jgi:hypothetical protein